MKFLPFLSRHRNVPCGGGDAKAGSQLGTVLTSSLKDLGEIELVNKYGIPVRELFQCFGHRNFDETIFAVLTGYMDESGDEKTHLFTLSCLVTGGAYWFWAECMWMNILERKNAELKAAGRKHLSRYHASYCSSRLGEFKGWTVEEQIEFTNQLIRVFQRYAFGISSYTLDLRDLMAEFPEAKSEGDARSLAHVIMLSKIMFFISEKLLDTLRYKTDRVALIHDRSKYDSSILRAFNSSKGDPDLKHRERFLTIAPMSWEDCVPLQLADLIAYENFKVVERDSVGAPRRKSFQAIIDLDSIGGRGTKLQPLFFKMLRQSLDDNSLKTLFEDAGIFINRESATI
jgi:hypothetical protein